jgi:hypothetical protein
MTTRFNDVRRSVSILDSLFNCKHGQKRSLSSPDYVNTAGNIASGKFYRMWGYVLVWNDMLLTNLMSVNREFSKYRQVVFQHKDEGPAPRTMRKFTKSFLDLAPRITDPTYELMYYRCRKCAFPLAPHSAEVSFTLVHDTSPSSDCTHIFLSNPLDWMESQISTNTSFGFLYCPRCLNSEEGANNVGEYSWMGLECQGEECGEIIAPGLAFYHTSDEDVGVELHYGALSLKALEILGTSPRYLNGVVEEVEPSDSHRGAVESQDIKRRYDRESTMNNLQSSSVEFEY